ncbi:MAG: DNA-3-methyladenine glycosylase, partial [bacterium]
MSSTNGKSPLQSLLSQSSRDGEALLAFAQTPPLKFVTRPALELAPDLLGCLLVHHTPEGPVGGFIVETEAYRSDDDPGCHAFRGRTPRNAALFARGGTAYVYLIYGMYYCMNIAASVVGEGTGVLIRGIEPVVGLEQMARNRGTERAVDWTAGPGRLTQSMDINLRHYGLDLLDPASPLRR